MTNRSGLRIFNTLPITDPIERIRAARKKVRKMDGQGWYRVINKTSTSAEIFIYDEIGYYGVDAQGFIDELSSLGNFSEITLRLNSPGGDVFDALAILNYLRDLDAHITVKVDSLAASAASFLAMAGDIVEMMPSSKMMIHEASGLAYGESGDLRTMADLLDDTSETIAEIYAGRAGGETSDWRKAMKATTYYSAEEAVESGLADRVADVVKKKPCSTEDRVARLASVNRMVAIDTIPEVEKVSRTDTVSREEYEDSIPEYDLSDILRQSLIDAKEDITDVPWDAEEFRYVMEDVRDHAPVVLTRKKVEPVSEPDPVIDLMMIDAACRAVQKEGNSR